MDIPEIESKIENLKSKLLESNRLLSESPQGTPSKSDLEENLQLKRSIAELEQRKTTIKESIANSATAGAVGPPKSPIQHVATLLSSGFDSIRTSLPDINIGQRFGSASGSSLPPPPPQPPQPTPVPVRVEQQSEDIFSEQRDTSASASASASLQSQSEQIPIIEGAPSIGPHILPNDKPGTEYAAMRMITALQTNLAPKSIVERLQNPVPVATATAATKASAAVPPPPHKVRVVFKARLAKQESEAEDIAGAAAAAEPPLVVSDQRAQKLVSRNDIIKKLQCELPVCVSAPIEAPKESKTKPKLVPLSLGVGLGDKATPQQPVALIRSVIVIKKLPKHIYLEEDPSLLLEARESGAGASAADAATPARITASRKGRVFEKPEFGIMTQEMQDLRIGDQIVRERLPRIPPLGIRASAYYMNNREKFVNFINQLFMTYHAEVAEQKETISCDPQKNKDFSLLTHQKIVRDYLNIYTPYRGLLLYHGLGSGKTCSSIAIAEGLKTHKKVIVMTPASLQRNYVEELKKCGDDIYKKNQYWEFIAIQSKVDPMVETLSAILSLPKQFIIDQNGAWLVNIKKSSNYTSLNAGERESLDKQLNKMISAKYQFINYNGMRMSHLNTLTSNFTENPFNDHVVVIDEAHNFISRIVNKLRRPTSLSMRMYELLMTAQNVKIILLSGTPVINYPNEVAIIFNILRGYIKVWKIPLQVGTASASGPQSKIDKKMLDQLFSNLDILDYMDYNDTSHVLTITRNPFGFVNVNERGEYNGVAKPDEALSLSVSGDMPQHSDTEFERMVLTTLKSRNINVVPGSITIETYKALPDSLDSFRSYFIDAQSGNVKNIRMFQRRILGLASYFRSAQEQLMPAYDKATHFRVIEIPMSTHQFAAYEEARKAERKLEKNSRTKKRLGAGAGAKSRPGAGAGAGGVGGDDIYEDAVSSYRIFSRLFCNFVFPTEIPRPLPKEGENVEGAIKEGTNEEDVDALTAAERIENMNGEHAGDDVEEIVKEIEQKVDSSYEKRIATALMRIRSGMSRYLTKAPQGELQTYSPKFLAMLENITEPQHYGLHLVYSQFRTIEGIGLFSMVLEANGFARFKIRKNESGAWVLDIIETDQGKPMYALYTGTESDEEREIIRNVFNSTWDYIPVTLKQQLVPKSANNFMGEIVKVLMITASGAEGINLRNVRYVHIMEPYWQPVRIEQVIGRARRICSHNDLKDEKLRSVYVMMYIMRFTPEQMTDDASLELRLNDVSKLNAQKPITTDQALFEISTIKEEINQQLLMAIKEASIDCAIHRDKNSKEKLKCFTFGSVMSNKFSYPPSVDNEESDTSAARNVKQTTLKLVEITASVAGKPVKYAYDKSTKLVYDHSSYIVSQEVGGEPLCIGKMETNKEGKAKLVPLSEIEKETGAVPVPTSKPTSTKLPTAASGTGTGGVAVSKRPSEKP
jgi:hypothetical protein